MVKHGLEAAISNAFSHKSYSGTLELQYVSLLV